MDLQLKEAADNDDIEKWQELMNLEYLLRSFLVEVLFEFGNDLQGLCRGALSYTSYPDKVQPTKV